MKHSTQLKRNRARLIGRIAELDRVIHEVAVSGTSSATLSSSAGSKSYTSADLEKLEALRASYASRVASIDNILRGGGPLGIRHVRTVRG